MIKLLDKTEERQIIDNLILACTDIRAINKKGFRFLSCCNGFIYYHTIEDFKKVFDAKSLREALIRNVEDNQWKHVKLNDDWTDYCFQRRDIYNKVINRITSPTFGV